MSIGPHRPSYSFSTIPSTPNTLPHQHMMNAPAFQQVMNLVPSPNSPLNNQNNSHSNNNNNSSINTSAPQQTGTRENVQNMYCDNCQTFRHVSFFQNKEKYDVCRMCEEREMQKKLANKERYEQYEEQKKTIKQGRYQSPNGYIQHTGATSIFSGTSSSPPHTSTQLSIQLPQMPITLGGNTSTNLPPPPSLATPANNSNSNNSNHSPQSNQSSNIVVGMNMNNNKSHLFSTPITPKNNTNIRNDQFHMHQATQPPAPVASLSELKIRTAIRASPFSNVDLITLKDFVKDLKTQVDFDRKLYYLDIQPLIDEMGSSAGFSQLGRRICEKVLEGTRFNFSLKDRRKSTKSPETLSTLRYYCSQRSDTAKPRKVEHPKAQLKYNCAGALTIIIDLSKKSANVTMIHKHAHPPFISHHQPKSQSVQRQTLSQQAEQLSEQNQFFQSQNEPIQKNNMLVHQRQQQTIQRFDALKQQLKDIGLLLDSQRQYVNEDFLKTASEALSDANEMVRACKEAENSEVSYPSNKYTLHYNKRGDHTLL